MAAARTGGSDSVTRWLLRCGLAAGPVFVAAFLVDGATRPGYRPLRHPVSSLSLGEHGWTQVTNFAVTGVLYGAGAVGLARAARTAPPGSAAGPGLAELAATGLTAAGLLGAGAFACDPVSGYPPGTPDAPGPPSPACQAHFAASGLVFLGIPATALAAAVRARRRGATGWAGYSAGTATAMLATMAAAGAGFQQSPRLVGVAGLVQRVCIVTGFGWLTALAGRALGRLRAGRAGS
jgi:Protein of unknown function (DUF998)